MCKAGPTTSAIALLFFYPLSVCSKLFLGTAWQFKLDVLGVVNLLSQDGEGKGTSLLTKVVHLTLQKKNIRWRWISDTWTYSLLVGRMEVVDVCSRPVPNGYGNKIFQANPKDRCMEIKYSNSVGFNNDEKGDASKHKKKIRGSRIWNFVSRKKSSPMSTKRPQSMIIFRDNVEVLEQNRKMSFMDKMRSFKKLRSSSASKNASKTKAVIISVETQEDLEQKALQRIKKLSDGQRPYRHSYAGYIEDLDSSFEDVELNSCVLDLDSNDSKWHRHVGLGINSDDMDNGGLFKGDKTSTQMNVAPEFESNQESGTTQGDPQRNCPGVAIENKKGRTSEVWSYLRGISLVSKDSSKLPDQRVEPSLKDLENVTENSAPYFDFEMKSEEAINQPRRASHTAKGNHFGGVLRFFNTVAEAARRWRGSSKTFSQEEQRANSSSGCRKQDSSPPSRQPLITAHDNASGFSSTGLSPDSGIWDNHSLKSSSGKAPTQGSTNAEVSHEVFSENSSFNEMSFSPPSTSLSAFPHLDFPNDCVFVRECSLTMDLPRIPDPHFSKGKSSQDLSTAPIDTWMLNSWDQEECSQYVTESSADPKSLGFSDLKSRDFTTMKMDVTDVENSSSLNHGKGCGNESDIMALHRTDKGTLGLSSISEDFSTVPQSIADLPLRDARTPCRAPVDTDDLDRLSQMTLDLELPSGDIPDVGTMLAERPSLDSIPVDNEAFNNIEMDQQDLAVVPADFSGLESCPIDTLSISTAVSDNQVLGSILEDVHSTCTSASLSCLNDDRQPRDRENSPIKVHGNTLPLQSNAMWKPCKMEEATGKQLSHHCGAVCIKNDDDDDGDDDDDDDHDDDHDDLVLCREKPLSHPLHPSPESPPFKLLLERCCSLPLSQSTPMGLDQLGWKRKLLLSTGAAENDLGSKTLEVHRDGKNGKSRWKPIKPGAEQLLLNKMSSYVNFHYRIRKHESLNHSSPVTLEVWILSLHALVGEAF
ncbi:hypothetical protein JD844_004265 [Phrynosoma platyrhinos]|uniref:Uncharacterized protein n=1 Tax=Phrynosoma platyrhinos TaxID=52577 RepID=A0ABQ7TM65_PHRPL|nr:hypothetical protein JD844_004265 [Phrynosoma platyrhinos]